MQLLLTVDSSTSSSKLAMLASPALQKQAWHDSRDQFYAEDICKHVDQTQYLIQKKCIPFISNCKRKSNFLSSTYIYRILCAFTASLGCSKDTANVLRKEAEGASQQPQAGLRCTLIQSQRWRAKRPTMHFKSNNSPLRLSYCHTLLKDRDRHQGTGVELGGFNSVWELTGEAFHLPQRTDLPVYFHLY